jgi:hypothetical protein
MMNVLIPKSISIRLRANNSSWGKLSPPIIIVISDLPVIPK